MSDKGDDLQRRALDLPRLTLNDLAAATGVSRSLLEKHRLPVDNPERAPMSADVARELARYVREHATELKKLATDLDRYAEKRG